MTTQAKAATAEVLSNGSNAHGDAVITVRVVVPTAELIESGAKTADVNIKLPLTIGEKR
jgi:hypothetical protein